MVRAAPVVDRRLPPASVSTPVPNAPLVGAPAGPVELLATTTCDPAWSATPPEFVFAPCSTRSEEPEATVSAPVPEIWPPKNQNAAPGFTNVPPEEPSNIGRERIWLTALVPVYASVAPFRATVPERPAQTESVVKASVPALTVVLPP